MREMATCPRCGRDADDEFVCAGCGAFLAGDEAGPAAAVSVGRVAVLVLIVCLLGAGGAALLLSDSGGGHRADQPIPVVGSPVELSNAPLGSPGESSSGRAVGGVATHPSTSSSATRTRKPSPTASTSAHPSSSAPRSSSNPAPTSAAPRPSTSHSTSRPPSSTPPSSAPLTPEVRLSKGTLATCGPQCFPLVVTLTDFSAGSHTVKCFSGHDGLFGSYTTSATTSSGCTYRRPNDTVYVVVDGHRSNVIVW